jgi:hypothetical protein
VVDPACLIRQARGHLLMSKRVNLAAAARSVAAARFDYKPASSRAQASIVRLESADSTAILRGLAFSATGTRSFSTPSV